MENQLVSAELISKKSIGISYISENIKDVHFVLLKDDEECPLIIDSTKELTNHVYKIECHPLFDLLLGHTYRIKTSEEEETVVKLDRYVSKDEFDELYGYDGPLGIEYKKEETSFSFWSPISERVYLKIEKKENKFILFPMKRNEQGVYKITVKGDLFNRRYNYVVYQNKQQKEIVDPYAKAVSVNSKYGVVIDINDVIKMGTVKPKTNIDKPTEAIIYELHIRDFTEGDKKVEGAGTYLGILKKVSYLKKLGVTHVQLLPVIDFGGVDDIHKDKYNWGYNPISFFALEGSYSAYPEDGLARLLEFKTLVNELHKNNIRVVMDVVYNHLYDYLTTNFQKNIPYYYFRKSGKKMANASGCGNDVASERKMVRRIIVDSIRYFVEVFDVDGFRFDLMGLIDIETSREMLRVAKGIKKDVLMYGEGWNMGVELKPEQKTSSDNSHFIPEMGFFNDYFRDVIKGSTFDHGSPGYILGNTNNYFNIDDALFGGLLSNKYASPSQSINYVECHDNQTLFDKLTYFSDDLETNLKRLKLANALTILSLGVPFIHMGQEIGLSKELLDNTYNVPKINNMDWDLVKERADLVKYTSDLIKMKKMVSYKNYESLDEIRDHINVNHLDNRLLIVEVEGKQLLEKYSKAVIIINPTEDNISFELDDYYQLYFGSNGLVEKEEYRVQNYLSPEISMVVFVK